MYPYQSSSAVRVLHEQHLSDALKLRRDTAMAQPATGGRAWLWHRLVSWRTAIRLDRIRRQHATSAPRRLLTMTPDGRLLLAYPEGEDGQLVDNV